MKTFKELNENVKVVSALKKLEKQNPGDEQYQDGVNSILWALKHGDKNNSIRDLDTAVRDDIFDLLVKMLGKSKAEALTGLKATR